MIKFLKYALLFEKEMRSWQ